MLNSFVARTAPQIFSANATFLNKVVNPALYQSARQFSVAYNIKSKFEAAYEKKMES